MSDRIGKWAGAGAAVVTTTAATAVAAAVGHHPAPVIAAAAATVGMAVGGTVSKVVSRAMNAGLNRVAAEQASGQGAGPIGSVMSEISQVLQALDKVNQDVAQVIDAVNMAQAHVQAVSRGEGNNLLNGAIRAYRQAPARLEEGVKEITQADTLMSQHLIVVAKGGT